MHDRVRMAMILRGEAIKLRGEDKKLRTARRTTTRELQEHEDRPDG